MDYNSYEVQLKDGTNAVCRFMAPANLEGVKKFLGELPEEISLLLPFNPANEKELRWFIEGIDSKLTTLLLAQCGDTIIGFGLIRKLGFGWSHHVGELLVIVSPQYQHKSLGTFIVNQLVATARSMGIEKLFCYVLARFKAIVEAFEHDGFYRAGFLKDFAMDSTGRKSDVVLLTRDVAEMWHKVEDFYHFSGRSMEH